MDYFFIISQWKMYIVSFGGSAEVPMCMVCVESSSLGPQPQHSPAISLLGYANTPTAIEPVLTVH